jgi:hypothetical protein
MMYSMVTAYNLTAEDTEVFTEKNRDFYRYKASLYLLVFVFCF